MKGVAEVAELLNPFQKLLRMANFQLPTSGTWHLAFAIWKILLELRAIVPHVPQSPSSSYMTMAETSSSEDKSVCAVQCDKKS